MSQEFDYSYDQYQRDKKDQYTEHIVYLEKKVKTLNNKLSRVEDLANENKKLKERIKELEDLVIRLQTK
uniref:Uncharacterized protein n=1 Tax=viral metagenome TaxID=1070528 RepID=A0A6C0B3V0_9ZZZZ